MSVFGSDYQKIQTIFKRDERKLIVLGDWTMPEFEYLKDCPWTWTEKVDGTNIRVHWNGENVTIGGRTDNAQVPTFLIAALGRLNKPELWAETFPDSPDGLCTKRAVCTKTPHPAQILRSGGDQ